MLKLMNDLWEYFHPTKIQICQKKLDGLQAIVYLALGRGPSGLYIFSHLASLESKSKPLAIRPEHKQKMLDIAKDLRFLGTILYELDFDTIIPLKGYTSHKVYQGVEECIWRGQVDTA